MKGMAKSILITMLATICIMLFTQMIFFFTWYSTLVIETFNISQMAASDNYVLQSDYDNALKTLQERPIYREKPGDVVIIVNNSSGESAIGNDDVSTYELYDDDDKPYRQRGNPLDIKVSAVYPLTITLWGRKYEYEGGVPASFSLTTIGLKHYKDLIY
ncbi:hypothetical protein J2T13_001448 [Paenibacillus sp. DS2015]|uniref:hypothetical protein n=1 Tax=Paenibacillus sp. DS2015 TaxID=3373917 RepID=UPI003D1B51EE